MNMFNYFRGKINKIEVDSPTKNTKNVSSSEQIYLQQISNYIQAQGGYDILKQKLFKAINQFYMHDSPFIQEIVILLRKGLQNKLRQKQLRTLTIIEDLIANCGKIMNEAFNNRKLCEQLYVSATFLVNLKVYDKQEVRQRIAALFAYWHKKYEGQNNYVYHQMYQLLKRDNVDFPHPHFIKQTQLQQKQQKKLIDIQQIKNPQVIIKDCQETANQTQVLLKQNSSKIDTNYVRMLKAKSKKLYALSTSQQIKLTSQQKQQISKVYKKIRNHLKQIQKINQQVTKQKAIEKQKLYLQSKMTPKKSQKQIDPTMFENNQKSPNMNKKQSKQQIILTPKKLQKTQSKKSNQDVNLLDIQIDPQAVAEITKKNSVEHQQFEFDKNLLDIQPVLKNDKTYSEPQTKQTIVQAPFVGTPQKKNKVSQSAHLLQLDEGTPSSQKKLNFKELYAVNQLSPELKDLDLLSPEKLKSKQSIASEQDGQFGDYS